MSDEKLWDAVRGVKDPEIGQSLVDLGMIYDAKVEGKKARITMTLTTPACPLAGFIFSEVKKAAEEAGYIPEIDLTFDPPWTPERISPELKKKLGF